MSLFGSGWRQEIRAEEYDMQQTSIDQNSNCGCCSGSCEVRVLTTQQPPFVFLNTESLGGFSASHLHTGSTNTVSFSVGMIRVLFELKTGSRAL